MYWGIREKKTKTIKAANQDEKTVDGWLDVINNEPKNRDILEKFSHPQKIDLTKIRRRLK